jgi:P-type Cu+ transporter
MKIDPICGMTVDEARALRAEREGETFYFCSEHCREKFLAQVQSGKHAEDSCCGGKLYDEPVSDSHQHPHEEHSCSGGKSEGASHSYARDDHSHHGHEHAAVKPSSAAKYFCPMCPGVESDKPGDCPKCGMALERNPAWVAPKADKTIYTCPMHPEVQREHPGNCPICGMALEPKVASAREKEEDNAELRDMTRRFWLGVALTLPVFVLAMAHVIPALGHASWVMSDSVRPRGSGGVVGGLAVLPSWLALNRNAPLEYVHPDCHWRGHSLHLQRGGDACAWCFPARGATARHSERLF